jgi:molybdate transport system regulatory protein
MATLWVVCGAGRGVGKTWIARGLQARLPDATYAKHGHGQARDDKPGQLLHDLPQIEAFLAQAAPSGHAVLESNAVALQGRADLCIFVEGQPRGLPRRDDADALRAAAHIVLDLDQPVTRWRSELERVAPDPRTTDSILELLLSQAQRLPAPPLTAGTKLWLTLPGGHGMGRGLVQLLEALQAHSTLREAARATGISYRHAWDMIRTAEQHLGSPLIVSRPGGTGGGGSSLTAHGLCLARSFRVLDAELGDFAQRRLAELLAGESGS